MDQFSFEINDVCIPVYKSVYAPVNSNMYTLLNGDEAVVFDPNENEELLRLLDKKRIDKVHILLTHGHYDHISGVEWLKGKTEADIFCQEKCAERLANSKRPLARLVAFVLAEEDRKDGGHRYHDFISSYKPFTIKADYTFEKNHKLTIGEFEFDVVSTPGHSEGSACYLLFGKMLFSGDTLLKDFSTITRFPGGNNEDYHKITLPYLRSLTKDTIIMPGHGNPFVLKDLKYL